MIIVTGSAGFIGSAIAYHLNQTEKDQLILVDRFDQPNKERSHQGLSNFEFWDREELFDKLKTSPTKPRLIIHMGAITDTAEKNVDYLTKWNFNYTKQIWEYCTQEQIPLIYASSAATYGAGEEGYSDEHSVCQKLRPLNPYGASKQMFDLWALKQTKTPPHWYGLKFFNVFGYGEFHKGNMASVPFHGFNQIVQNGELKLFKSHKVGIADGEQKRDFVYIKDILKIIEFLSTLKVQSGIYNCGSGKAETFLELSKALFAALDKPEKIKWIDTPVEFRAAYQYFTEADMTKLRSVGFKDPMTPFKESIADYVEELKTGKRKPHNKI